VVSLWVVVFAPIMLFGTIATLAGHKPSLPVESVVVGVIWFVLTTVSALAYAGSLLLLADVGRNVREMRQLLEVRRTK
jgi:hypothetical protein